MRRPLGHGPLDVFHHVSGMFSMDVKFPLRCFLLSQMLLIDRWYSYSLHYLGFIWSIMAYSWRVCPVSKHELMFLL